ncbi:hypothetical protein [Corynebacterium sanguinis]|uniref:hypothetical protein n=1 Tax=Corynebacterium sanguinis TaxID=2594913 RepID=UPI0021A8B282|nr:hypothetical protein [Corynebacterium sanguinis]MCT1412979.1 hypothetical protein [Corynebacterium sanguinis]
MTLPQLVRTYRPPFSVPSSLDELRGPKTGTMTVPHSIMWARNEHFVADLDNDDSIRTAYCEILGSAALDDLIHLINKDHLRRLWPVTLDRTITTAWEERFPTLLHE